MYLPEHVAVKYRVTRKEGAYVECDLFRLPNSFFLFLSTGLHVSASNINILRLVYKFTCRGVQCKNVC
jgi:hypothetical protein